MKLLYDEFVKIIISKDSRNIFEQSSMLTHIDNNTLELYKFYDPIDVEFEFNSGIVRLIAISELEEIQEEYSYIEADCVFGTLNGDPIFTKDGKVFTCLHGSNDIVYEELASSFEDFIKLVIDKK